MGKCVSMLARSFLIESSSKLLVTRTGIKARLTSILGQIRPLILELLALEWRKFYTFELEYLWSQLAYLDQGFGADWIKTLVSMATESPHWLIMGKMMSPPFLGWFYLILFIHVLAGNKDMHKISDEIKFGPDQTRLWSYVPLRSKKFPIDL